MLLRGLLPIYPAFLLHHISFLNLPKITRNPPYPSDPVSMPAQPSEAAASRLKLIIRRLPPTLPEETFWKAVDPWVDEQTCLWKRYIRGKPGDA
jgi:hypothetical protein